LTASGAKRDSKRADLAKSEPKLRVFLDHYGRTGRLYESFEKAGIGHNLHYRRLDLDEAYRAAFAEAQRRAGDAFEDLAVNYAYEGEMQALLALLKKFKPEYRDRGGDVQINVSIEISERLESARQRLIEIQRADSDE